MIRKRGGAFAGGAPLAVAGALAAGLGVFPFAPLLDLSARAGRAHTLLEMAMRPIGEWDLVLLGAGVHRWLLLASAAPAVALAGFGFASKRVRPLIGGVALGTCALLLQLAWTGDAAFIGGPFLLRVWVLANAAVCLWLARTALRA